MRTYKILLIFFLSAFSLFAARKNAPYVEGDVLVRFISSDIKPEYHSKTRSLNLTKTKEYRSFPALYHLKLPAGVDTKKVIEELSSDPEVLYAEPNYIYEAFNVPNDQYYEGLQWALPKINLPSAWDKTTGSSDVIIAVIDSGVDYNHPDLYDNIWTDSENYPGYNAIENNADPMDDVNHGTHCAGIIGAVGNNGIGVCGVNWTIKIMALKFIDTNNQGTAQHAINCIDYIIRRKEEGENIVAVNGSWGGDEYSDSLYDAIERLETEGILFVASAGNSGDNNDVSPIYPASYSLPNIISVASSNNNDERSGFSNYGRASVHIAAPGSLIYSTIPSENYGYKSGTSMAAPFVAGIAGLISDYTDERDAIKLKDVILKSAMRLPQWTNSVIIGGRLNAEEALRVASLSADILPVDTFYAQKVSGKAQLTWNVGEGVNSVIIRRGEECFPSHWEEGALVYAGGDNSFTDESVEEGKIYYYTIWAYYGILPQIDEDKISAGNYAYINSSPTRPECILPEDKAIDISLTPLLKATFFSDADNDSHKASQWQIVKDEGFTDIVWVSTTSPSATITVLSNTLSYSTLYYWRVRYQDEKDDWSEWAVPSSFTTIERPSGGGGGGGGGCFIATAAFGSPLERNVQIFKEFRDKRLLTNRPGRVFIRWYYRYSPKYADIIKKRPALRVAVRTALTCFAYILRFFI
ncbi:MAG: S8 family peptidase [Candidatus Ratteibacteria bacterium]